LDWERGLAIRGNQVEGLPLGGEEGLAVRGSQFEGLSLGGEGGLAIRGNQLKGLSFGGEGGLDNPPFGKQESLLSQLCDRQHQSRQREAIMALTRIRRPHNL